ncbi:MAG: hypothetical protein ACPL1G_08355 [Thermodesulfovibrionales bacterium]
MFKDEEKENGLILVFNNRNHKNLQWTEDGSIVTALVFTHPFTPLFRGERKK